MKEGRGGTRVMLPDMFDVDSLSTVDIHPATLVCL